MTNLQGIQSKFFVNVQVFKCCNTGYSHKNDSITVSYYYYYYYYYYHYDDDYY